MCLIEEKNKNVIMVISVDFHLVNVFLKIEEIENWKMAAVS